MIPGTKEFFIAAKDHDEWGSAHTVWGMVSVEGQHTSRIHGSVLAVMVAVKVSRHPCRKCTAHTGLRYTVYTMHLCHTSCCFVRNGSCKNCESHGSNAGCVL